MLLRCLSCRVYLSESLRKMGIRSMAKKFSVILPIYGYEEGYLEVRVESWMNQNYPDEDFEVIIVEDGSPDQARVAETLSKYKKVRLILLPENHGRIEARNIGVNLAAHDTVCLAGRYVVEPDYLSKLSQLEYYPAIVPPVTDPEGTTYFGRLFYLFRRRIYPKYFPPERYTPFYIDETNYKKVPKHLIGITCAKDLWSEARPDVKDKYTHDEAIILRNLIRLTGRVLVAGGIRLMYQRRRGFWEELRHMKGRGPLFASFYFVPGGRYHKWYLA
ncbi:MAG: glycosyltransferase, partial [Chloroflexi bacterium]|nr:glycosyltransferase [Chloroflexota bacterium]